METAITFQEVASILGEPQRKLCGEWVWQCPYCLDSHKDNMRFNTDKGLLWCFADNDHSKEIVKQIYAKRDNNEYDSNYVPVNKPVVNKNTVKKWEINHDKYIEYMIICNELLLKDDGLLDYVYKKRGLTKESIDINGLGFDDTENCFVIPIYSLKHKCIVDFELREKGEVKKIRRVGGGCSTIVNMWCGGYKTLYITEGMIDAMVLIQYLRDKGLGDESCVYSCSNGVTSLFNCMDEICFGDFKEIKLMLDADDAGSKATKEIIEKYPFIKDVRKFLFDSGCKDFGEFYMSTLTK